MKDGAAPLYVTREEVLERLALIFPMGIPNRNYCVRELAASTVFTALYIGAVEGSGRYLGKWGDPQARTRSELGDFESCC